MILPISIGFLFFLMHRTDFIAEYAKIFGIKKLLRIYEYEEWKANNFKEPKWWLISYPTFIRELKISNKYLKFLSHLFGCPICSIVFFSLIINLILGTIYNFLYIGGLATLFFLILDFFYKKN